MLGSDYTVLYNWWILQAINFSQFHLMGFKLNRYSFKKKMVQLIWRKIAWSGKSESFCHINLKNAVL
jgi:hypothetical protein